MIAFLLWLKANFVYVYFALSSEQNISVIPVWKNLGSSYTSDTEYIVYDMEWTDRDLTM